MVSAVNDPSIRCWLKCTESKSVPCPKWLKELEADAGITVTGPSDSREGFNTTFPTMLLVGHLVSQYCLLVLTL